MTEPVVLVEQRDHTLLVAINRPRAANSINAAVHQGLGEAWERADSDKDIRAVVLTGAGDSVFCGGADLKALGTAGPDGVIRFAYAHVNSGDAIRTGRCVSRPELLADGRIRLHEEWEWTDGDGSKGVSVVEEVKGS